MGEGRRAAPVAGEELGEEEEGGRNAMEASVIEAEPERRKDWRKMLEGVRQVDRVEEPAPQ